MDSNAKPVMQRGDSLNVTAHIELGSLTPEDVLVELYHGSVSNQTGYIEHARRTEMRVAGQKDHIYEYQVRIECADTGFQGHTIRILPKHEALVHPYRPGFVKWT